MIILSTQGESRKPIAYCNLGLWACVQNGYYITELYTLFTLLIVMVHVLMFACLLMSYC